ncbi:MAG: 2-oxo acid dehydrogenase subunit E2 [Candidatus Aenigmatarchaeota archaeon]|nr:MAG: 2-oxo acid dehydrogenase subunit E2 [Candidatus Aenigmarchaeota archaeon]
MAYEFKFPDVGEGIHEGELVKWRVSEGAHVNEHDIIAEVETDKAVVEVPSPRAGVIAKLNFKVGDTINVGDVMVVIAEEGDAPVARPALTPTASCSVCGRTFITREQLDAHVKERHASGERKGGAFAVGELEEAPAEETRAAAPKAVPSGPHVFATPAVRALAKELGVDIERVDGTGPDGRVTEEDLRKAKESGPRETAAGPRVQFEKYGRVLRVQMSATRRAIARHMLEAYAAPHVVTMDDADVTALWDVRAKEKQKAEEKGVKLTFMPFIVKACLAALKKHPHFNASLDGDEIVFKKYYNMGIAVHTNDGLMVPVVKDVDKKTVLEIAKEIEELAERARTRTITLEEMKGQSFTLTNYGSIGGTYGVPMINSPDVAILGIGRIDDRPVARDGKIEVRKILPLSLSFDHRVVDGAQAAYFLQEIIAHLEDPNLLMIDE